MTGKEKCTDLGGLFRTMPLTCVCGIVGALSISSFPLTSGFVSKSMISQGAADLHLAAVWYLLAAASAGVFLHAGIKFPWFVFFQKDSGLRPGEPPWNMKLAMVLLSGLCIGLGVVPGVLYAMLPYPVDYVPYTAGHVIFYLQLLLFSGLAFFQMLGWLKRTLTITLDTDWLWRGIGPAILARLDVWSDRAWGGLTTGISSAARGIATYIRRHHGPDGSLARTWATGSMAFWTTVVLAMFLILSYV
jgi:multicomponent Na+:H+ antiporter subunit D